MMAAIIISLSHSNVHQFFSLLLLTRSRWLFAHFHASRLVLDCSSIGTFSGGSVSDVPIIRGILLFSLLFQLDGVLWLGCLHESLSSLVHRVLLGMLLDVEALHLLRDSVNSGLLERIARLANLHF